MSKKTKISGATAPSGTQYVIASRGGVSAIVSLDECTLGATGYANKLAIQGYRMFDNADRKEFIEGVKAIKTYPNANIAERIGWADDGSTFAMPDGTIISGSKSGRVDYKTFLPKQDGLGKAGTQEGWLDTVAIPLSGLLLGEFMLIFPFVSPVMQFLPQLDNFGILLVAPKGKGKTTLLDCAASVIGGVKGAQGGPYWALLNSTINALEDHMETVRDHPLMLDDSSRALATLDRKQAGQFMAGLAYLMEGGQPKARLGVKPPPKSRFTFVITANAGMLDLYDKISGIDDAALDRLLTIRVPEEWCHGTFEAIPKGYEHSPEFATALRAGAIENHGHAFRKFMKTLTKAVAKDRDGLLTKLEAHVSEFVRRAALLSTDGTDYRIVQAFAAIYAAGKLAVEFESLPSIFKPGKTALAAYRLHLAERKSVKTPLERLEELAASAQVLRIDERKDDSNLSAKATASLATLHSKSDRRELRIHPSKIEAALPGFNKANPNQAWRDLLIAGDGRHLAAKSTLAPGMDKERLYRFRLPLVAPD